MTNRESFNAAVREEVAIAIRKLRRVGVSPSVGAIIARMNTGKLAGMPGAIAGTNSQWAFAELVREIANL
jgi:hypothetical protein